MYARLLLYSILSAISLIGRAQSTSIPLNRDYFQLVDRYRVLSGKNHDEFHPSAQPYTREKVSKFIGGLDSTMFTGNRDQFNRAYLLNDNWEYGGSELLKTRKPFLKHFYTVKPDFYQVDTEHFNLHVNPVMYFSGGKETAGDKVLFINTRGIEIRGIVDKKVGFYSFIGENQMRLPLYAKRYAGSYRAIPHEGFWKDFKGDGYDFFSIRGHISFQASKHINIQFGRDNYKAGIGQRSLILSDFAPPSLYLKFQTNVWKFNYTNLFTQLTQDNTTPQIGIIGYPQKFMAFHHLSLNIGKKVNVGFFESVMFGSPNAQKAVFEPKYLNPVIFYRAVEHQNGSTDNAMVGIDAEYIPFSGVSLYGQLVFDEFLLKNIRERNGWWGNKTGIQTGIKYYNSFGIDNLDITAEFNTVRPYTYSHHTPYGSYSNFMQPLAHPLGANFKEVMGKINYQPIPKLQLTTTMMYALTGRDTAGVNWGSDIFKSYRTVQQAYGNKTGQGLSSSILYVQVKASYMVIHNMFIDLTAILREEDSIWSPYDLKSTIYT
ncbi:MAG: hypothetical protein OEY51_02745, partial [Cyclobacteriaceae bacterium]|nr:hypothetical protein [Cyclobacteriaceae bacterium]